MSAILLLTGITAIAIGAWRGFVAARIALGPLIHDGDPTRTLIEAGRPVFLRSRVRTFARNFIAALGWLAIAIYGLFLVSVATGMPR
jgi:hypothetical protein